MAYLAAAGFILVVVATVWMSSRQGGSVNGCCAPADPRKDLRMRAAYTDDETPPS
ncbi:hypothetical protein J2X46_002362 [Nocardioides sp. BE266]|nr:hypothetical protein [Nocardioides sp. BE266]